MVVFKMFSRPAFLNPTFGVNFPAPFFDSSSWSEDRSSSSEKLDSEEASASL